MTTSLWPHFLAHPVDYTHTHTRTHARTQGRTHTHTHTHTLEKYNPMQKPAAFKRFLVDFVLLR